MSKWQPIETAPKDGTEILIFDPEFNPSINMAMWLSWGSGDWVEPHEQWAVFRPTHWMPLPNPPEDKNGS